jgi:hypothetical protein
MEFDEIKSRSECKQDFNFLLIWILIRCWTSTNRLSMDSSPNLVPERSSGCAPLNSNGTSEEPRTTRAESKRARTGKSSSNGEVSTQSVVKGSFFALQIMAARHKIVCAIQISLRGAYGLFWKFERLSLFWCWALLRRILISSDIWTLILGSWW